MAGNCTTYSSIKSEWLLPLTDYMEVLQFAVTNTGADITTSVSNSTFVDEVTNAEDDAYIVADYSGNATMPEEAFEAIAGTDKTIDLVSEGITWRFAGKDITEEIKDIDLNVEIKKVEDDTSASGEAIQENLEDNPGVVMKFPENGTLPGKATIQVKVDYAMRQYLGNSNGLCVYYYNNQTGKLELIAQNLSVVNDTYVEFEITHCSYYVLTVGEEQDTPIVTAPTAKALTYNGSAQALVNAGSTTSGTMQYSLDGVTYSANIPAATNAGTYTVYYKIEGSQAAQSISVTIAKAKLTITAVDKTAAVGAAKPTMTYTVAGLKGSDKLTTKPTLTCNATMSTAGEYEIIVTGGDAGANYEIQRVNGKLYVKTEHKVTVSSATNGTVTVSPEKAIEGTLVTITVTPSSGYQLSTLTVKNAAGTSYTASADNNGKYGFTMPNSDVTVTATFTTTSTATADTTNPKTSDEFNMVLWSSMAATSLLCMAAMVLCKKKHG